MEKRRRRRACPSRPQGDVVGFLFQRKFVFPSNRLTPQGARTPDFFRFLSNFTCRKFLVCLFLSCASFADLPLSPAAFSPGFPCRTSGIFASAATPLRAEAAESLDSSISSPQSFSVEKEPLSLSLFESDEGPMGGAFRALFPQRSSGTLKADAKDREARRTLESLSLPAAEGASFLGLAAKNGESRKSWFPLPADSTAAPPDPQPGRRGVRVRLKQTSRTLMVPAAVVGANAAGVSSSAVRLGNEQPGASRSAQMPGGPPKTVTGTPPASVEAPVQAHASMVQVHEATQGIGTMLAGAGISTLLGGLNQYQMGPFSPATPTSPGVMPGAAASPLPGAAAPGLAAPAAALPQMSPAATALAAPAALAPGIVAPQESSEPNVVAISLGIVGGLIALCLVGGCVYTATKKKRR
ncbi:putative transmembrane protein [Toxoplasma gondii RUB]|uniref:Putative transmembrane protein n=1 Tax=Toxoplasma gondii RUB TaxID=935652 RepID=A0A086LY87_TOXGO|nr:putative transmembrane protein [Toxoplasma gondii RUB]